MAPSELGVWNSKRFMLNGNYLYVFSERLKAIYPAVKALGRFLLRGWQAGRQKSKFLKFAIGPDYQNLWHC